MRKRLLYKNLFVKATLLFVLLIVTGISVNAQTFIPIGSASNNGGNCYTIVPNQGYVQGNIWNSQRIDLRQNFNIFYTIAFTNGDAFGPNGTAFGADGMAFVLQNASTGTATVGNPTNGQYLGYANIAPSLAVEYDIYQNGEFPDYGANHISIQKNGNPSHGVGGGFTNGSLVTAVAARADGGDIKDGLPHTSRVVWNATTKTMYVYFDNVLRLTYTGDIINAIYGGNPYAFFGFTGASGYYFKQMTVCYNTASTFTVEGGSVPSYSGVNTTISKINALCNGSSDGSITVVPTAGTAPFTYTLSGRASVTNQPGTPYSFANLSAGSYILTTRDIFGNSKVENIQITEPALPVITSSTGSNILCANTSLDLKVLAGEKNLLFNNSYAEALSIPAIELTTQLTMEAWVKLSDVSGYQYIVSKGIYDTQDGQYGLAMYNQRFTAHLAKNNNHVELIATNLIVQPNVWYHLAGTWDGATLKIYVNGNLENSMVANFSMTATTQPLQIGRLGQPTGWNGHSFHYPIKGAIDELRIWNAAKSSTEINANKNQKVLPSSPNLVAYYALDEGTGNTLSDAVNGNTATLYKLDASNDISGVLVGNLPLWQNSTAPINYASYLWLPGSATAPTLNVTTAGAYSATVTSVNGCINGAAAYSIVTPTALVTTHTASGPLTFCAGGSVTLTANATAASYNWTRVFGGITTNNYATGKSVIITEPGVYSVDVTDVNGCVYTHTLLQTSTVTVNPLPAKPIITASGPTTFCQGAGSLTLSTAAGAANYLWMPVGMGGNSIPIYWPETRQNTVTITDANGCKATSDPMQTTVKPAPIQYTVTGGGTICAGGTGVSVNLSGSELGITYNLVQDGSTRGVFLMGTGGPISFANLTEAAEYRVRASNLATDCHYSMAGSVFITVNAAPATPTITSSTGKFDFCAGSSINLISSASSGNLWSNGSTSNQITVNASSNYTVTVTGGNGCTATSTSVTTTSVPLPAVGISVSNYKTTFCQGETALYYVPNPNAGLTYVWTKNVSFTFGDEVPVGTGPNYSATATGWYTATATNSTGCSWSSGMIKSTFVAASKPTISTSTGSTTFCAAQGQTLTLSSSGVNGSNIWSTLATSNTITLNTVGTNNYTVSSLDANGCRTTSDPITITGAAMPTAPTISAASATTFCAGGSVTLNVSNAAPELSYQWMLSVSGESATDIPDAINPSYVATTAGTYTVRAINAGGCVNWSGSIQVIINAASIPVMDLISLPSCGGVNTTNGRVQFRGVVSTFVNWKNSLGTVISTDPYTPNLGAGSYTATAQDACGVLYTKTIDVVAPAPLSATFTNSAGSSTLCAGTSTTLTANTAYAYAWYQSVGGGANINYSSAKAIVVNTPGDYYVQLQDAYGCTYYSSVATITVLPAPTNALDISLTSSNNCIGNFTGSATAAFVPNTGSGTPTFSGWTGPNSFASNSLSITNRPAGTYTATAVDFCGVTASKSVTILAPITQFTVSGGGAYCAGGTGVSINLSGSEIGVRYELIKGLINQGIFIEGTGSAIAFNNITAAGNYLIRSERTADACAIMASSSATVSVTAFPQVFTVTGGVTFCSNDLANFTFTLDGTTAGANYAIHKNDGSSDVVTNTFVGTGNSISFNLGAPTSNTTTYTIMATSATGGCAIAMNGAATFTRLASPAIPTISASGSTTICPSSTVTLTSSAAANKVWMPGSIAGNTLTVSQAGSYTVTTTAGNGCSATSAAMVVIVQDNVAPVATIGNLPDLTIIESDPVTAPTATDNCATGTITGIASPLISSLVVGVNTVIWTYNDGNGNSSSQTQTITVTARDVADPYFKTLVDIVKNNDLGTCGATITYPIPLANDDGSTTKVTMTEGGGDNTIVFDVKKTYRVNSLDFTTTGEYKDIVHGHGENISVNIELGNTVTGTWTLVKTIQTGTGEYHFGGSTIHFPEIAEVNSIRFIASQEVHAAFHFYEMNVNLNSIVITQTGGLASGAVFPIGETVNTFTATDLSGKVGTASFKVTILDAEKPTISSPSSSKHFADATGVYTGSGGTVTFNDNCANALTVKEQYYNQLGGLFFEGTTALTQSSLALAARAYPLGINRVVITATDAAGNSSVTSFTVTVEDNTLPTITPSANITKSTDPSSCGAYVNVTPPVVADNCKISAVKVVSSISGGGASGYFPIGVTTLTWTVIDGSGNSASATQTITVTDQEAPYILNVPNNLIYTSDAGTCGAVVNWAPVRAADNCSVVSLFTADHMPGETFPIGVTTVNYLARDQYNNVKTASFTITVTDNEAPTVRTRPFTVTLINGSASITTANINNGTTDNCVGAITYALSTSTFTCANVGSNLVTLTATDAAGNASSGTALVTVTGQQLSSSIQVTPSSTVFTGGIPTNIYLGYGSQTVTLGDNVVGSTAVTYLWSGTGISATRTNQTTVFTATAAGLYTITCTATNSFGCTTTSTVNICVRDIRSTTAVNSPVYVCHTNLQTGVTSTLTVAVNQVATQLQNNPQDLLGTCGMPPCSAIPTVVAETIKEEIPVVITKGATAEKAEKLTVKVSPNPSATSFNFIISSNSKLPVNVQIMDGAGRMMEAKSNAPIATNFRMGERLVSGMYYAIFIQGQERVVVKLIKQDRF